MYSGWTAESPLVSIYKCSHCKSLDGGVARRTECLLGVDGF